MRRTIALVLVFGFLSGIAGAFEFNIDPNQTGSIVVSNNFTTPTQIFTNDPAAMRTYIINTSTSNIFIVGFSTTSALSISSASIVSTSLVSGSFYIVASTSPYPASTLKIPIVFSPDGPTDPYRGPMWAVSSNLGAVIQRFRAH